MKQLDYSINLTNFYKFSSNVFLVSISSFLLSSLDFIMIGGFGEKYQAALGQTTGIIAVVMVLAMGIYSFTSMKFAKFLGSKADYSEISKLLKASLFCLVPLILLICLIIVFLPETLRLLRQPEEVVELSQVYTQIIWLKVPFSVFVAWASFLFRVMDIHKLLYIRVGIALTVNFCLNYFFLFHYQVFSPIETVAISTIVSEIVGVLFYLPMVYKKIYRKYCQSSSAVGEVIPYVKDIFKQGIPISISILNDCVQGVAISIFVGWMGTNALAAYNVAFTIAIYMFRVPQACVAALQTFYAYHLGQGTQQSLMRYLAYSFVSSISVVSLVFTFSDQLLGLFNTPGSEVFELSQLALLAILLYFPFYFVEQHLNVVIVAHERAEFIMKASSFASYICMIPLTLWVSMSGGSLFVLVVCQGVGSLVLSALFSYKILDIYGYFSKSKVEGVPRES